MNLNTIVFQDFEINQLVTKALNEDLGSGDITTNLIIKEDQIALGKIVTRERGIIAGIEFARKAFEILDEQIEIDNLCADGDQISPSQIIMTIKGKLRAILSAERVALNFLQRMSGIATTTASLVKEAGENIRILDTRKTTPTLRKIEKYSVSKGGGVNHRYNLSDMILIKDNHIRAYGGDIDQLLTEIKQKVCNLKVEIEINSVDQLKKVMKVGVDRVMLDNMSDSEIDQAIQIIQGRAEIEVSGNMNLGRLENLKGKNIDFISIGALTHSYQSLDIALDID